MPESALHYEGFPEDPYFSPPPTDLPDDDGEPLETPRHRRAMNLLIDSLGQHWRHRDDYYCGGNMFIYYSAAQAKKNDFRGPDFFVVLDTDQSSRRSWVVWDEGGRFPDVIVELMSPTTATIDCKDKKELYRRVFKTHEYYVYDPYDEESLKGWRLDARCRYRSIAPGPHGRLWCESLGLWLGIWHGGIGLPSEEADWLRFFDPDHRLVLLPQEAAQRNADLARRDAEQAKSAAFEESRRADALAAKLRELGIDPDEIG